MTYGENGLGEKFKKIELHSEIWGRMRCDIWGEWVHIYEEPAVPSTPSASDLALASSRSLMAAMLRLEGTNLI